MEARIRSWNNKVFGIELTAENEEEQEIMKRFWVGGIKVNVITELQADLVDPFELRVRRGVRRGQPTRIITISYTPCPDADDRLQKALAVLFSVSSALELTVADDSESTG